MNIEKYVMLKNRVGRNVVIRYMYKPIIALKEFYVSKRYYSKHDEERILSFRKKYSGKRCFIIGNGPSLSVEDLEILKGEYSFATNRIYNIFLKTSWRPSFYVCVDPIQLSENKEDIDEMQGAKKFISCRSNLKGENIYKIFDKRYYVVNPYKEYEVKFSDKLEKNVVTHSTVTYVAIELAIYMGFSEIILLGVDHNFKVMTDNNNKIVINNKIEKNHFSDQKESSANIVFDSNGANRDFKAAYDYAIMNGIHIYNATRGGHLEIFERKNFEEVFKDDARR